MTDTNSMIERVARAIYQQRQTARVGKKKARSWGELSPAWQQPLIKQAEAALEAMRLPTPDMCAAANDAPDTYWGPASMFTRMIDAALNPK